MNSEPSVAKSAAKAIGAQLKVLRLRIGRTRAEAQRRRGGKGRGRFACEVEVIPKTGLVGWKRKIELFRQKGRD